MVRTPNYDLDIDTTLGGANASDYVIPSQKAIKDYVDNHSGGGGSGNAVWGDITGTLSDQEDLQAALDEKQGILNPEVPLTIGSVIANVLNGFTYQTETTIRNDVAIQMTTSSIAVPTSSTVFTLRGATPTSFESYIDIPYNIGDIVKTPRTNTYSSNQYPVGVIAGYMSGDEFMPVAWSMSRGICVVGSTGFTYNSSTGFWEITGQSVYSSTGRTAITVQYFQIWNDNGTLKVAGNSVFTDTGSGGSNAHYGTPSNQTELAKVDRVRFIFNNTTTFDVSAIGCYDIGGVSALQNTTFDLTTLGSTYPNKLDLTSSTTTNVISLNYDTDTLGVNANNELYAKLPTIGDGTITFTQGGKTKGTITTNQSGDTTVELDGSSRNIGEYVLSSLPLVDGGLHLADGSLIPGGGIYDDFVDYIANLYKDNLTANYFTTESDWQTSVSTYGVCGKYVYDSENNTVRLPKVTGFVEGTVDASALGNLIEAGLPNITGSTGFSGRHTSYPYSGGTGALRSTTIKDKIGAYTGSNAYNIFHTFNASLSNPIYGNSATVQPQSIQGYLYICIATSAKTDIQINIDNIATDINNKADKDGANISQAFSTNLVANMSDTSNIYLAHNAMPSNTYEDLTLGATTTTYAAPADGWYYLEKLYGGTNLFTLMKNTTAGYATSNTFHSTSSFMCQLMLPVKKGDVMQVEYNSTGAVQMFRFYYAVGSESEA